VPAADKDEILRNRDTLLHRPDYAQVLSATPVVRRNYADRVQSADQWPSLRRAARFGDAWYPIGSNSKHLLDTLPRYRAGIARLRQLTAEAGREPASVALTYRVKRYGEAVPAKASDGERRLFSGSTTDIIADLRALRDLGVGAVDIDFERSDLEASVSEMSRFKEQAIARL
jgi:alkanesulfonate monooxygenase SsuD/methylene tetrahydromethanopterin reductase-like flavin-dependent oxidoreductase (luciferase family)